jgi:hypothetical protein
MVLRTYIEMSEELSAEGKWPAAAQYCLAELRASGEDVPQDYVYAHMWANLAAASGMKKDAELREQAAKEMTPSQLEKAQDLACECVCKNYKGC